ncbi:MAG: hypothetical protein Q8O84_03440, partial [Nanoarchaeota archaeon]|nr:hypothetical protein [Nanoarchaeota archaeon]
KFLSEEEIKKVENYSKEKLERERLKREQEEKLKREQEEKLRVENEKREKIRIEQEKELERIRTEQKEAKKPKAILKIGGSIGMAYADGTLKSSFFEINPLIKYRNRNTKDKIGLNLMYGSFKIKDYRDKIKYNNFGIGLNLGLISPSSKIEYDYFNLRIYRSIIKNERGYRSSSLFLGQELEFFPFQESLKNVSFSLEAGIFANSEIDNGFEVGVGLKYTFGK